MEPETADFATPLSNSHVQLLQVTEWIDSLSRASVGASTITVVPPPGLSLAEALAMVARGVRLLRDLSYWRSMPADDYERDVLTIHQVD